MSINCPQCNSKKVVSMETVATDVIDNKLNFINYMICKDCDYEFTAIDSYKLEHISTTIVDED